MIKNVGKYLNQYAEDEVNLLTGFPQSLSFENVMIIPAFKESIDFVDRFINSDLAQQNALVIIVINQPEIDIRVTVENNAAAEHQQAIDLLQQQLFQQCLTKGMRVWQNSILHLVNIEQCNSSLLIVDRFTRPIPEKLGVGLARKIGCDLALSLISQNIINTNWLYSTDADAHLPNDYFVALPYQLSLNERQNQHKSQNCVAACFNFSHHSNDTAIHQANFQYEQALRYYVAGLTYANSAYAFYTIGSVLAFNAQAYATVRGFPKRSAGEDFYIINKLAKLGEIEFIDNCSILLDARTSDRVPFGTGPAVSQILALKDLNKPYCYYNPNIFDLLKELLNQFKSLWQYRQNIEQWLDKQPIDINICLVKIGLISFVVKQINEKQMQFDKQLIVWFDAFKTLKFIHALREQGYDDIPISEAIDKANFSLGIKK